MVVRQRSQLFRPGLIIQPCRTDRSGNAAYPAAAALQAVLRRGIVGVFVHRRADAARKMPARQPLRFFPETPHIFQNRRRQIQFCRLRKMQPCRLQPEIVKLRRRQIQQNPLVCRIIPVQRPIARHRLRRPSRQFRQQSPRPAVQHRIIIRQLGIQIRQRSDQIRLIAVERVAQNVFQQLRARQQEIPVDYARTAVCGRIPFRRHSRPTLRSRTLGAQRRRTPNTQRGTQPAYPIHTILQFAFLKKHRRTAAAETPQAPRAADAAHHIVD